MTPPSRPAVVSQREKEEVLKLPLVREVMDLFQARVVDIRPESVTPPPPVVETPEITPEEIKEEA